MPSFNPANIIVTGKRKSFAVPGVSSLYLRVSENGTKTWTLKYKLGSLQRKYTIGRFPELSLAVAKKEALRLRGVISLGSDPQGERKAKRAALTVKEIADLYIQKHAMPKKRTWEADRRHLDRDVLPFIGNQSEVTRRDIAELLDRVADRGSPIASNRLMACVRGMFNWAIREGYVEHNPAQNLSRRGIERSRERVLSDDEIVRFWQGLPKAKPMSEEVRDLLRIALLTGQRIGEVTRRPEIADGVWILRQTKNGHVHRVPLLPMAAAIFARRTQGYGRFAATRAWTRVRASLGFADVNVHDLRRTMASQMASLGIDRVVIGKCLNHISIDRATITGAVYDRYSYEKEKVEAFRRWEEKLEHLISSQSVE
jgi:integrase